MKTVDVAIIGGGPAGLSAGLMLGRAMKQTKFIYIGGFIICSKEGKSWNEYQYKEIECH